MALKRNRRGSKKVSKVSCDEEWVRSTSSEAALNSLVVHGILPDRATAGWRLAAVEDFLTPHTNELVVFEDYFFCGFGVPIHPFLHGLIAYYNISLCNLPQTLSCMLPYSFIFVRRTLESSSISIFFAISSISK